MYFFTLKFNNCLKLVMLIFSDNYSLSFSTNLVNGFIKKTVR